MSKKTANATTQQPPHVDELLNTGTTTLTAKTREEISTMLADITVPYSAGAIGKNPETGEFSLRIDKI